MPKVNLYIYIFVLFDHNDSCYYNVFVNSGGSVDLADAIANNGTDKLEDADKRQIEQLQVKIKLLAMFATI